MVTFKKKENTSTQKINLNTFLTLGLTNYLKHPACMVHLTILPEQKKCIPHSSGCEKSWYHYLCFKWVEQICWTAAYWSSFWRWRCLFNMNSHFHASITVSFSTSEIVGFSHIKRNNVPSCSSSPIVERMISIAALVVCLV